MTGLKSWEMNILPDLLFTPWGAVAIASLLLLLLVVPVSVYLRREAAAKRVQWLLEKHVSDMIMEAVIPDGIDGYVFADYLLRIGNSIVVLNVEPRKGYVFGAPNIDEWTCVENNRTSKFSNPLKRAKLFAQQCSHVSGFDDVRGYVLFGRESEFPKGLPEGVVEMVRFEELLESFSGSDHCSEAVNQAWSKLQAMSQESGRQINSISQGNSRWR